MKKFLLALVLCCLTFNLVHATPRQIVLLRHADKLPQEITGPAISAKGYARAIAFSFYILDNFGEPDFVVAGKPKGKNASIRELQTVGPLVNIMAARHPENEYPILHPYTHDEIEKLSKYLLNDKKFDNKFVLVCWRHSQIADIANLLGVQEKLEKWPHDDFDSVFILDYGRSGKLSKFTILHDQYPVTGNITWESIHAALKLISA